MYFRILLALIGLTGLCACATPNAQNGVLVTDEAQAIGGALFVEQTENGDFLVLDGKITSETSYWFQALATQGEVNGLIILQSPGGDPVAAHQVGRTIKQKGINTFVVAACFSACIDIFIAGKQRIMYEDGKLGLHAWKSDRPTQETFRIAQQYWTEMGYSRSIMAKAFKVPHEQIWLIEPKRARSLRMVTDILSPEQAPGS
ncbi:MAG: hypothetical protein OXC60_06300 [Litoreibacter sp.]|nr:hypothetical protein [Litoreibacter sp.]